MGTSGTFTGTGSFADKLVIGCWIKAGANQSGAGTGKGTYVAADGSSASPTTLDLFFAERHTTQSNFRIDTNILLENNAAPTFSPLYD